MRGADEARGSIAVDGCRRAWSIRKALIVSMTIALCVVGKMCIRDRYTQEEIAQAIAWVDSIPRKDRFSNMSDHEIRQERLIARGLATRGDFS